MIILIDNKTFHLFFDISQQYIIKPINKVDQ